MVLLSERLYLEETNGCGWIVVLSAIMVVSVKALKFHADCWTKRLGKLPVSHVCEHVKRGN